MVCYNAIYLIKFFFSILSAIHFCYEGGCIDQGMIDTIYHEVDGIWNALNSKCQAELNIQVWSKEKLDWSQKAVGMRFPSYFSMLTGCAVDIGKYHVLFIGGHHTKHILELHQVYPIQTSINDQTIEYNFKNATWKSLSDIPLSVRVHDILYTYNL